jgi:hypothetical protein
LLIVIAGAEGDPPLFRQLPQPVPDRHGLHRKWRIGTEHI